MRSSNRLFFFPSISPVPFAVPYLLGASDHCECPFACSGDEVVQKIKCPLHGTFMIFHLDRFAAGVVLVSRGHHTVIHALVDLREFVRLVPMFYVRPFVEHRFVKPAEHRK